MKLKFGKWIGAIILTTAFVAQAAYALGGNGFLIKFHNRAANNQDLYAWSMIKGGYKPGRTVLINGNPKGQNNIVIPISFSDDISNEVYVTDKNGTVVWDGIILFHSKEPSFDTQIYTTNPDYTVTINGFPSDRYVTFDIG